MRSTVEEQAKGAQIRNIAREVEKGRTQYEVETLVNGKSRDFTVSAAGGLLSVEEQVALEAIPAVAKAAIEKKASGGKVTRVEAVTESGATSYEAAYTKAGKPHSVTVRPDGSEVK